MGSPQTVDHMAHIPAWTAAALGEISPEDSFRLARRSFFYTGVDPLSKQHSWTSDSAMMINGVDRRPGHTYPWVARIWFLGWQLMDVKLSEGALHLEHCLLNECGPDDVDIDEAQALVEAE